VLDQLQVRELLLFGAAQKRVELLSQQWQVQDLAVFENSLT
jgi:hypothetical protein